jgi:hypothetical protein
MKASYFKVDGEETLVDAINSGRMMAVALGFLLQEREGIVVDLPYQEEYPDDMFGRFMVYRHDGQIKMQEYNGKEESGTMLWVHDDPKECQ